MKNTLLYICTVLVWGSTWLAIEFQLGEVAISVSLFYRFVIAAVLMWMYCAWAKIPLWFSVKNHAFIALLALFNFSLNYSVLYWSQEYLTSAMTSIAFSTMLLMNIVNTRLFFGIRIAPRVYLGACCGIIGIAALFWNDLVAIEAGDQSLFGLALVLTGALIASFGNMVSVRNSRQSMNVFAVNAWGMLYGTLFLYLLALISGAEFNFSFQPSYIISLLYLSVFGTVIAFATYYILLRDIGPEKASYVLVFFPVVAVVLSSLFEGFVWSANIFLGFVLVLIGNAILLTPTEKLKTWIGTRTN